MTIKRCSIADLESSPQLPFLLTKYAEESAIPGMGNPSPSFDQYKQLESSGALHPIGAWKGDDLVGFVLVLVWTIPHYGRKAASTESFFVEPLARPQGFGLKLLANSSQNERTKRQTPRRHE